MLAGFMLIVGGGLVALGSHQDWLTASLPQNASATLNVVGTRYGTAMLVLAMLIAALGVARIARGYAEDRALHRVATVALLAAIALAFARTGLFMADHNLAIGSPGSYGHLDLRRGVYLMLLGAVTTISSRLV